ncbi:MAG: sigma-70 family RNA polymerase sigma factor [Anaeromassilibacillus sp.]
MRGVKDVRTNAEIERVVNEYATMLLRVAYSQLNNRAEAEDTVQEVLLKYMEKAPIFQSEEHEKAWLLRVTVNHCKNHLASAWFRKRADLDEGIPALDNAELEVVSAVAALPAKYRAVVHLYYFEGYSTKEIAEILHSRPNTVSSRLSRARALLAKALKEEIV